MVVSLLRSEHKLALSLAEQIEKIGEERNDIAAQLLGRGERAGPASTSASSLPPAPSWNGVLALLIRHIALPVWELHEDPYSSMLAYLAMTLAYLGYIDQARSRMEEALSEARRLRHVHSLALVLLFANWIDVLTCSPELQRHAEELLALSTEHGFALWLGWATAFRGRSLTALGQAQEGLALLTQGLAAVRATGAVTNTPMATYVARRGPRYARAAG